jgi:hypothetical protein
MYKPKHRKLKIEQHEIPQKNGLNSAASSVLLQFKLLITLLIRVHEIAYGFGGPSEKNVSPH